MTAKRSASPPPRASRAAPAAASEALELLTADELAARWNVTVKHVYALARDGDLPCVRLGKYVRFRAAAVTAWLDAQEGKI